jgi:lipopolysaccharide transport protein LptA
MLANSDGSFISYEGDVVMWQGADRLKAKRVEINREHGTLKAFEDVRTQFPSQRAAGGDPEVAAADSFTVVSAEELIYLEEHNLAHYKGGVHLVQPGLNMTSRDLKAYFQPAGAGSSGTLDRAVAQGRVRIRQKGSQGRMLDGFSERAEYYLADERLVLTGGRPKMVDSERGTTQGSRLTYFARNDRLQVDGAGNRPTVSSFRQE